MKHVELTHLICPRPRRRGPGGWQWPRFTRGGLGGYRMRLTCPPPRREMFCPSSALGLSTFLFSLARLLGGIDDKETAFGGNPEVCSCARATRSDEGGKSRPSAPDFPGGVGELATWAKMRPAERRPLRSASGEVERDDAPHALSLSVVPAQIENSQPRAFQRRRESVRPSVSASGERTQILFITL